MQSIHDRIERNCIERTAISRMIDAMNDALEFDAALILIREHNRLGKESVHLFEMLRSTRDGDIVTNTDIDAYLAANVNAVTI